MTTNKFRIKFSANVRQVLTEFRVRFDDGLERCCEILP